MRHRILIILILTLAFQSGNQVVRAQEDGIKAKMDLDTSRILIGDQVNLWLHVSQPSNVQLNFPQFIDTLVTNVEVIEAFSPDTISRNNNLWSIRQRIILTSFDTGFYVLPGQIFQDNQTKHQYKSNAVSLEVMGIEVDTTKGITDIKLPYDIPVGFWEIFPYLMVGILIIGAFLLWYFVLRKKKQEETKPTIFVPQTPPHIWALGELDKLVKEKLWQQGKNKLFYSRLTEIVRQYIEWRFQIPALEQTTSEIMDAFDRSKPVNTKLQEDLHNTLELSDLVKFAKWKPDAEENEMAQKLAYDFVLQTKPTIRLRTEESGEKDTEEETV